MNRLKVATEPWQLTIVEAASMLRSRSLSCRELVESVLDRAAETEQHLHAWVEINARRAREDAKTCDLELANGQTRGPLHGIPLGIKDIFDVEGMPTKCGSRSREDQSPAARDAATVARLREAGAILLGKTVTQEFAAGVVSPPARNPWDPGRIPGGSSGGTASAIAGGSAVAGMGSDTGGSIRIPASVCGTVGYKPTFGVLSLAGVHPLSWSLDTAGPLARTVDDATLMFRVLRPSDQTSSSTRGVRPFRIGVPRPHFFERLQTGVASAVEAAIDALARNGVEILDTPWPEASAARACSFIINRAETSAVHIHDLAERWEGYGEELRLRIEAGAFFPANAYLRALQARSVIKQSVARVFEEYDLDAFLTPSAPGTAAISSPHPAVPYPDGSEEGVSLAYTRLSMPFNITGQPAMSLPCGFDELGLPVGLQLAGRPYADERLLSAGRRVEDILDLGVRFPELPPAASND